LRRGNGDRVDDLPDEVGEHHHGKRRRRAQRLQHRPQHGRVERPPGHRAEEAHVAGAHQRDRVAHRVARGGASGVHGGLGAGQARRARANGVDLALSGGPEGGERQCASDDHQGADRGNRGQREWPVAGSDPESEQSAGDRDRRKEDRIEHHEEGEQHARRGARAQARAPEGPDRQGRASNAARGQQARGRGATEGDLSALA
jgi:hypothetical protein